MSSNPLISPEVLIPRLGEQLVKTGLITNKQLKQALDYQRQCSADGKPRLLGQAVVDMGFIDRATLDRAITELMLHLRAALEDANRNLEARVQQRTIELEEALRRLSEINQLKANFVANVSHELRTPLTHIRGYLDLLDTESLGPINSDQKKALDVSLRSATRLQSLIDDLILFSQASRGEMSLTLAPIDLNQVISNVVTLIKPKADDHQIELGVNVAADLPFVQADKEKLSWVILQLLDNAIKFTKPTGEVHLVVLKDVANNSLVTVTVSDTGIGISPEHLKEIFEPFHQLDSSATRRYGGTGLGLALVRLIVEAHASVIDVQSEIDKGTMISFPLLISKDE
jgi:signal transduction histidine kinase